MSQTLQLADQVQRALAQLNILIKEHKSGKFDAEMLKLRILKEMLQEQDVTSYEQQKPTR